MDQIKYSIFSQNVSDEWDEFVLSTSGGTLHSRREFLNYHKEKFEDLSFIFTLDNEIVAVLAAAVLNDKLVSHPGASYGGLIYKQNLKLEQIIEIKKIIFEQSINRNIKKLEFRFPYSIISKNYFDKFKYTISSNTHKVYREISQFIDLDNLDKNQYSTNFVRILKKNKNIHTKLSTNKDDISSFYKILEKNLLRHDTKPTHTLEELVYLIENLDNCKLFLTIDEKDIIVSGTFVIELTKNTAHTFYLCSDYRFINKSPLVSTIDFVAKYYKKSGFNHLNLGISSENRGESINLNLNMFKEKFNSYGTVRETFNVNVD